MNKMRKDILLNTLCLIENDLSKVQTAVSFIRRGSFLINAEDDTTDYFKRGVCNLDSARDALNEDIESLMDYITKNKEELCKQSETL